MSKGTQDFIIGCTVFVGLVLLSIGATEHVVASLTSQGTITSDLQAGTAKLKPAAWQIAPVQSIGPELALGMLLILLALTVHVFFVLRRHSAIQKSPLTIKRAFYIAIGRY